MKAGSIIPSRSGTRCCWLAAAACCCCCCNAFRSFLLPWPRRPAPTTAGLLLPCCGSRPFGISRFQPFTASVVAAPLPTWHASLSCRRHRRGSAADKVGPGLPAQKQVSPSQEHAGLAARATPAPVLDSDIEHLVARALHRRLVRRPVVQGEVDGDARDNVHALPVALAVAARDVVERGHPGERLRWEEGHADAGASEPSDAFGRRVSRG